MRCEKKDSGDAAPPMIIFAFFRITIEPEAF